MKKPEKRENHQQDLAQASDREEALPTKSLVVVPEDAGIPLLKLP